MAALGRQLDVPKYIFLNFIKPFVNAVNALATGKQESESSRDEQPTKMIVLKLTSTAPNVHYFTRQFSIRNQIILNQYFIDTCQIKNWVVFLRAFKEGAINIKIQFWGYSHLQSGGSGGGGGGSQ